MTDLQNDKRRFGANISELMNIIINSFYSNRDVFLRELISNSSDAIDKQRILDLQNSKVGVDYYIKIDPLTSSNSLVIEDNGVGMSQDDLVNHLSTIATSGTKEFVKNLAEKSDQIGQFGVGFYSAFLVADSVDVYTRKEGDFAYRWSSDANEYYTIEKIADYDIFHGTRIVLHLKEDCKELLEESTLRRIINQHSNYILHPIELYVEKEIDDPNQETESKDDEIVEETDDGKDETKDGVIVEDEEDIEDEDGKEESKVEPKPVKKIKVQQWEKVNGDVPIWYKKASETSDEEYSTLYKNLSKDWEEPLFWRHFQTEGAYEFRGILFIPKKQPFDMFERNKDKRNIKLYVKKVLVLNELDKEMLPDWMSFIVGVFDSPDLPLNVSREVLQQTKIVKAMKTQLKKQISNMIADLFSNDVKYNTFYENFHRHLKLGIHEGDESLLSYLKLKNSKNDQLISFDTYIEELKQNEEQKTIYYATGSEFSENTIVKLYLEKGYHLLYFDEPIDEFVLQRITKYKEYELVNVAKDHTTPWHQEIDESQKQELKEFTDWIKKTLDDTNIEDVRISTKLTGPSDDPIFILGSKWGWTGQMEKIMKAQPLGDSKNMSFMKGKKIVEINFGNPIICNIKQSYIDKETDAANQLKLIYQCSLLSAGYPLENTSSFVKNIYSSLNESINISS